MSRRDSRLPVISIFVVTVYLIAGVHDVAAENIFATPADRHSFVMDGMLEEEGRALFGFDLKVVE